LIVQKRTHLCQFSFGASVVGSLLSTHRVISFLSKTQTPASPIFIDSNDAEKLLLRHPSGASRVAQHRTVLGGIHVERCKVDRASVERSGASFVRERLDRYGAAAAPCTGPGAPTTTQTKCLTAVAIPGNPLRSFDINWVNPKRAEYYLGDRSNNGIDIIDTRSLTFKRTIGGFVGIKLGPTGAVNNNISGPVGVTSHGRWLYGGDGDSTLKVIDLDAATSPIKQSISTGGTTRVDEMALTTDGNLLLAANNTEDPPFATLFAANGDRATSKVSKIIKISVNPTIIPAGAALSLEQPAWDPTTKRFYNSLPIIANNPPGCNFGQLTGPVTCHGGLLAIDPQNPKAVYGAFDPTTHTGVIALPACSPNGATVGVDDELMLGCTPGNNPSDTQTTILSAQTTKSVSVNGITGPTRSPSTPAITAIIWAPAKRLAERCWASPTPGQKFFIESIEQFALGGGRFQTQSHFRSAGRTSRGSWVRWRRHDGRSRNLRRE
jgi:hypothetical protein